MSAAVSKTPFAATSSMALLGNVEMDDMIPNQQLSWQAAIHARLPATYHCNNDPRGETYLKRIDESLGSSVHDYFEDTFNMSRLNNIEKWLWIAGLPRIARPLHKQMIRCRRIIITEQADSHLVWDDDGIFIKPLSELLLDHAIWETYLNQPNETREAACGFLLSYLWLICSESDFYIARENKLIPGFVEWKAWSNFAASAYDHLHDKDSGELKVQVNRRYRYGELRLTRLNAIYRYCVALPRGDIKTFIFGYAYSYTTYQSFFRRNTAWLITLTVYVGVVLTAMQVGLATSMVQNNWSFHIACYVFTIFAILAPLTVLGGTITALLVVFSFHAKYAIQKHKEHISDSPKRKRHP